MPFQTCIECEKKFESESSNYFRENMCQKCGDSYKKQGKNLTVPILRHQLKNGPYRSSPPEGGRNVIGKTG